MSRDVRDVSIPQPVNYVNGTASATDTSSTQIIAAPTVNSRLYITSIIIANVSGTNTFVNIKDGSTTKLVYPAPANGGCVHVLPTPLKLTSATALNFTAGAGVTTMYVSAIGYMGE